MKIDLEGTQGNVEYKEILYTVFSLKLKRWQTLIDKDKKNTRNIMKKLKDNT